MLLTFVADYLIFFFSSAFVLNFLHFSFLHNKYYYFTIKILQKLLFLIFFTFDRVMIKFLIKKDDNITQHSLQ